MFGIKKKVKIGEVNDFLCKEIKEVLSDLQFLKTKNKKNFEISEDIFEDIVYEYFFYLIYVLHTTGKYTEDSYLEDLFDKVSDFLPKTVKSNDYSERFPKIDITMKSAVSSAQNSGGLGAGILSGIMSDFNEEKIKKIKIRRNKEMEEMIGVDLDESDHETMVSVYLSFLTGMLFGEFFIDFSKKVEIYFKRNQIIEN
jgi:hypothetical protein